jgi:hypothetical protein
MPLARSSVFSALTRSCVVLIVEARLEYRQMILQVLASTTLSGNVDTAFGARHDPGMFNTEETSMQTSTIRQDTKAWKAQVWISFGTAATLCATGLAYLPGKDIDRAFMVMGYLFCLTTAFVLAKYVRDNETRRTDTPLWGLVVWGGFGFAMALTAWGLWGMDVSPPYKAYLGVCWLYLISSLFTLAKTLRDAHEALIARTRDEARAEMS